MISDLFIFLQRYALEQIKKTLLHQKQKTIYKNLKF